MTTSLNVVSTVFGGCKIEHDGKIIQLNEYEQYQLLGILLDSHNGLTFDMSIESPEQFFVMACNNGRYNIALRAENRTSGRQALFSVSPVAMEGMERAIAEAIAASPTLKDEP